MGIRISLTRFTGSVKPVIGLRGVGLNANRRFSAITEGDLMLPVVCQRCGKLMVLEDGECRNCGVSLMGVFGDE